MDGEMGAVERKRVDRRAYLVAGAICLVAVVAVIGGSLMDSTPDRGSQREAVAQCEGFADSLLKAPATADYNLAARQDGESWIVVGTVDSENGFGALLRNNVRCDLTFDGDIATLENIDVG